MLLQFLYSISIVSFMVLTLISAYILLLKLCFHLHKQKIYLTISSCTSCNTMKMMLTILKILTSLVGLEDKIVFIILYKDLSLSEIENLQILGHLYQNVILYQSGTFEEYKK